VSLCDGINRDKNTCMARLALSCGQLYVCVLFIVQLSCSEFEHGDWLKIYRVIQLFQSTFLLLVEHYDIYRTARVYKHCMTVVASCYLVSGLAEYRSKNWL